jgi:hypothetical protein
VGLLQNLTYTIYYQLQALQTTYTSLVLTYGYPTTPPTGLAVALEHDKTKVDEQYELAGFRRRPRVFFADVYSTTQADRNDICELIKDMFENKNLPVLNASHTDTGVVMIGEGVRVEVDSTQRFKARAKIYVSTMLN